MIFLENYTRLLLILHAIAAAALVATTTHHLVWAIRRRKTRFFAGLAALLFVGTFLGGALLYPTYKVRVRAEYFDNPAAVQAEEDLRTTNAIAEAPTKKRGALAAVARLFDIKEHWVALGCMCTLAAYWLSRTQAAKDARVLYLSLCAISCGTAWFGAVVGLYTVTFRAVGGVR